MTHTDVREVRAVGRVGMVTKAILVVLDKMKEWGGEEGRGEAIKLKAGA